MSEIRTKGVGPHFRGSDGAIVVGDRTHGKVSGQTTTLRSASQVYLRVK